MKRILLILSLTTIVTLRLRADVDPNFYIYLYEAFTFPYFHSSNIQPPVKG